MKLRYKKSFQRALGTIGRRTENTARSVITSDAEIKIPDWLNNTLSSIYDPYIEKYYKKLANLHKETILYNNYKVSQMNAPLNTNIAYYTIEVNDKITVYVTCHLETPDNFTVKTVNIDKDVVKIGDINFLDDTKDIKYIKTYEQLEKYIKDIGKHST